jgi:hypothetical protein
LFNNNTANQGGARHVTHIMHYPRCRFSLMRCLHVTRSDLARRASPSGPCSQPTGCPLHTAASSQR